VNVPDLILIESISVALFVIDFNGPAVASDARETVGLPVQVVGHQARGRIWEVGLAVVDDQAVRPKVMDAMSVTVTVLGLLFARVEDRHFVKDGESAVLERVMMLVL
jgi:hypothetical protein